MPSFDRLIIGAGPAGLAAAIACADRCLVLERNSMAGKKLLASGSGQCNFTHMLSPQGFLERCSSHARFLKPAIYGFGPQAFIDLLREYGCESTVREDRKVFPASLKAADVRDALLRAARAKGARIGYNCRVTDIDATDGFRIETANGNQYSAPKLVLAGGGASWPGTGSDGSCHGLARLLGHSVHPPRPALAAIDVQNYSAFRSCAGIALPDVTATFHGTYGKLSASGSLLFTHTGLSGPLILDHAHLLAVGDSIKLCLISGADERLIGLCNANPAKSILGALKLAGIPEALLAAILKISGVEPTQRCADLGRLDRRKVAQALEALELKLQRVESLATAMLTAGGVDLGEVNAHNMMSRLRQGLYFAGEVLDYNLPSGGFNIQAAFSTGWLAGRS